jgi:hypothetical protein
MKFRSLLVALSLACIVHPALADKDDKGEGGRHNRSLPGQHASGSPSEHRERGESSARGDSSAAPSSTSKRRELTDEEKQHRKEHMAELRAKWGEVLKKPGVKEEMHTHLSTLAKLRRIAKLAREDKKEAVEKRAEAAIKQEKQRHDKKMDELKGTAAPGASASAPGSAGLAPGLAGTAKPTATTASTGGAK